MLTEDISPQWLACFRREGKAAGSARSTTFRRDSEMSDIRIRGCSFHEFLALRYVHSEYAL